MDLISAVTRRTSTAPIQDEAPTDAELLRAVGLALHAPDHARLRPWRLVTVRGGDRDRLGAAMSEAFGDAPGSPEAARSASRPLRAPLLLGIVLRPVDNPKVPEWEQLAATAAMVATLELVLFDAGWTAMWRTGPAASAEQVRAVMGVGADEQLLGWLYVGRTDASAATGPTELGEDPSAFLGAMP